MTNISNKNNSNNAQCDTIAVVPAAEFLPAVADFLRRQSDLHSLGESASNKLQIVADEVFSNIVKYSGATSSQLAFLVRDSAVTLIFEDNGTAYDPTNAPPSLPHADQNKEGGRGIYLIEQLTDKVRYSRCNDKNILKLTIEIKEKPNEI